MKTVLIIDSDLGFVFWLGRILQGAGCEVIPAKSSAEASVLLSELSTGVDLLIVDSRLAGVVAFADEQRRSRPKVKILVAISDKDTSAGQIQLADVIARKPPHLDDTAASLWLGMVEHAFGSLRQRSSGGST
ncbi:MAG TPA: response regulator [Bryobacteraceae bacterium]|nr:response regulator [Bryobacteraceae bacterium]